MAPSWSSNTRPMQAACSAEAGHAGHGVAGRAPGRLDARAHGGVQLLRPFGVDQVIELLTARVTRKSSDSVRDHVDEGVADPDDVEAGLSGHEASNYEVPFRRPTRRGGRDEVATVVRRVREPPPAPAHRPAPALRPHADARPGGGHVRRRGGGRRRGGYPTADVVLNAVEIEIDEATGVATATPPATVSFDAEAERATPTSRPSSRRARPRSPCGSAASSTTSWSASTARPSPTTTSSGCWPPPRWRPPTPAGPSCWDEPDAKAGHVTVPDDLLAISNAGEVGAPAGDGKVACASPTPCRCPPTWWRSWWAAGGHRPGRRGRPLRCAPAGQGAPGRLRAEVGSFALRYFTDWFGMVYLGDKLDLVAIPDFVLGAMENLGCVTSGSATCSSTRPPPPRPSCRRWT